MDILGMIAHYFNTRRIKYLTHRNTAAVNNTGGTVSGSCILTHPENILYRKEFVY